MQIRISFIVGNLSFGGATTLLLNLAAGLQKLGVPIRIDSLEKQNAFLDNTEALGPCVFFQNETKDIFEYRIAAALKGIASFNPTAVVGWIGPSSCEVLRYIPKGILRLAMIHCDDSNFFKAVEPYVPDIDGIVGVSEEIRQKMSRMPSFSTIPIHYIPNGSAFPETLSELFDQIKQPLRILYFGRLENEQKRVRIFPDILKELQKSDIPFQWTIAGSGPEEAFLKENLKTNRSDQRIQFEGEVAYNKIPDLLSKNEIFLLASNKEGLPMALLEAMGHGLVPVVSDLPSGIREVVDSNNGILVPVNNIDDYAHGIVWLHEHRDRLAVMREAAYKRVAEKHSIAAMSSSWLSYLQKWNLQKVAPTWPEEISMHPPLQYKDSISFWSGFRPFRQLKKRIFSLASK